MSRTSASPYTLHPRKYPSAQGGRAYRQPRRCGAGRKSFPLSACSSAHRGSRLSEFRIRTKVSSLSHLISHANPKVRPRSRPTSVIWEPLVAFPLEVGAIKLGALLFTEILGSLRTVLRGTTVKTCQRPQTGVGLVN